MSPEIIKYEPPNALFATNNGLENYYQIIKNAKNFLKTDGKIFLEIGFNQSQSIISILEKNSFTEIELLQDLAGHDRVLNARVLR